MGFELDFSEERPLRILRRDGVPVEVRHFLRAPNLQDWLTYESRLQTTEEMTAQGHRTIVNNLEACGVLWDKIATGVDGYFVSNEDGSRAALQSADAKGWKAQVPLAHKRAAVEPLTRVFSAFFDSYEAGEQVFVCGGSTPVKVVCEATSDDLVHVFAEPNARQEIAASRIRESWYYQRGDDGRTARSVQMPVIAAWVELYDQLIRAVSGYTWKGAALASRGEIVEHMDAIHKMAAVNGLFNPMERPAKQPLPEEMSGPVNMPVAGEESAAA